MPAQPLTVRTLRLLLPLVLVAATGAQQTTPPETANAGPSLNPSRRLTQYGHDVWQHPQGLPQNGVTALAQTPDGYLWLGTEEGLVRFDGLRFTVFDRASMGAFVSNDISSLYVDSAGVLWIGTRGGGLVAMRDGSFAPVGPEVGLDSNVILALRADRRGRLLVGTTEGLFGSRTDASRACHSTRRGSNHRSRRSPRPRTARSGSARASAWHASARAIRCGSRNAQGSARTTSALSTSAPTTWSGSAPARDFTR